MANYPTSLDSLINPSSGDTTTAVDHAAQHANVNDAVEALEAKLGIGSSVAASGKLLRGTGAGASAWDKDAPTGTIVGTTDSQTLTNKTLTSPTINTAIINNPTLKTDTIAEFTANAGVTVDGMLIKDSKLATNNSVVTANITDDAVTAAKIDWAATGANGGIWWEELGRTTLGAAGDNISIASIATRKYLLVLGHILPSGATTPWLRFNNDTANNYSIRYSASFGAGGTLTSTSGMSLDPASTATDIYLEALIVNVLAREKTVIGHSISNGTAGAANAPADIEVFGKWANTANAITRIDITNTAGAGDFAIGSQIIVLGHD